METLESIANELRHLVFEYGFNDWTDFSLDVDALGFSFTAGDGRRVHVRLSHDE